MNTKYYFWDDGNGLVNHKNVTMTLSWNIIPNAGNLPRFEKKITTEFKNATNWTTIAGLCRTGSTVSRSLTSTQHRESCDRIMGLIWVVSSGFAAILMLTVFHGHHTRTPCVSRLVTQSNWASPVSLVRTVETSVANILISVTLSFNCRRNQNMSRHVLSPTNFQIIRLLNVIVVMDSKSGDMWRL